MFNPKGHNLTESGSGAGDSWTGEPAPRLSAQNPGNIGRIQGFCKAAHALIGRALEEVGLAADISLYSDRRDGIGCSAGKPRRAW